MRISGSKPTRSNGVSALGRSSERTSRLKRSILGSQSTHVETCLRLQLLDSITASLPARLPFPKWDRIAGFSSGAAANYNALLLSAERRFSGGLVLQRLLYVGQSSDDEWGTTG